MAKIYSLPENNAEAIQSVKLPWNSTQILAAVKAFKYAVLGSSYSDELHYKLFKNISVEIHPFIRLYSEHLHASIAVHQLAVNLMVSSEKSPFDDFLIFVLLFERKKLSTDFKYLTIVLVAISEKGMLKPFDHRQILQVLLAHPSPEHRKRTFDALAELLVLRKGLIREQEVSIHSQIDSCVTEISALLSRQNDTNQK